MNVINNSPDITKLDFHATFDLSNVPPLIKFENQSTGPNLIACKWWYDLYTPSRTPIHIGAQTMPDMSGNWAYETVSETWPQPMGQIEFSKDSPYVLTMYVMDSEGNVYSEIREVFICRPGGNKPNAGNNFGVANTKEIMHCETGSLNVDDITNYGYQGMTKQVISKTYVLDYPRDETDVIPAPVTIEAGNAKFLISQNGSGHTLHYTSVLEYNNGLNTSIIIKWKARKSIEIQCNIDLCGIACEYEKLIKSISDGSCTSYNSQQGQEKLLSITSKIQLAMIAIQQPGCGLNASKIIEEIKVIGGFNCNCELPGSGIGVNGSGNLSGISIDFDFCGDISVEKTQIGDSFSFKINGKRTVITVAETSSEFMTITESVDTDMCERRFVIGINAQLIRGASSVVRKVLDHTTGERPSAYPASYFPVDVWNTTNNAVIGTSDTLDSLVNILNTNGAWAAYGTAFNMGFYQIGFITNFGIIGNQIPAVNVSEPATVCPILTFSITSITMTGFTLFGITGLSGGTYDISLDNGATYSGALSGLYGTSKVITGLSPSTLYNVVIRYNCGDIPSLSNPVAVTTNSCAALSTSISNIATTSFDVNVSGLPGSDTYDISLDGGATYPPGYSALSASVFSMTGLTGNTLYQVVIRHNCAAGGSAVTSSTPVTTASGSPCGAPGAVSVASIIWDAISSRYNVTVNWTAGAGAINYNFYNGATTTTVVGLTATFPVLANKSFGGSVSTNCASGISGSVSFSGTTPAPPSLPVAPIVNRMSRDVFGSNQSNTTWITVDASVTDIRLEAGPALGAYFYNSGIVPRGANVSGCILPGGFGPNDAFFCLALAVPTAPRDQFQKIKITLINAAGSVSFEYFEWGLWGSNTPSGYKDYVRINDPSLPFLTASGISSGQVTLNLNNNGLNIQLGTCDSWTLYEAITTNYFVISPGHTITGLSSGLHLFYADVSVDGCGSAYFAQVPAIIVTIP